MAWVPPRDAYEPGRFISGDALRDYLCTCSAADRNRLLLTIDVEQIRSYVMPHCIGITRGEPRGFVLKAREKLTRLWGTVAKADELIGHQLMIWKDPDDARRVWMERRGLSGGGR